MSDSTQLISRAAVSVGDFLYVPDERAYGLVIARQDATSATVLMSNGQVVERHAMGALMSVSVAVPQDFDLGQLTKRVAEREEMAEANRRAAEMLRLAAEAVRQIEANQPGAAAEFARVIGEH